MDSGQTALEKVFSWKKEVFESLISQKMMYDYMIKKYGSSLHEFNIPNSLILECKSSND